MGFSIFSPRVGIICSQQMREDFNKETSEATTGKSVEYVVGSRPVLLLSLTVSRSLDVVLAVIPMPLEWVMEDEE